MSNTSDFLSETSVDLALTGLQMVVPIQHDTCWLQ